MQIILQALTVLPFLSYIRSTTQNVYFPLHFIQFLWQGMAENQQYSQTSALEGSFCGVFMSIVNPLGIVVLLGKHEI